VTQLTRYLMASAAFCRAAVPFRVRLLVRRHALCCSKYWKAILGFAFWLGPIWDFIKWLLDWHGRIDALAASYHDLGGYHVMIAYILNPPSWLYPPFMLSPNST
jgi:hypothetical protein